MLVKILLGVLAVLVVFVIVVATRPSQMHIVRSTIIAAPAASVFPHVNDLHQWLAWSPWEKLDPEAKKTYEGPEAGTGAKYAWDGNSNVGAGKMTIVESRPDEAIQLKLEFLRPFENTCDVKFGFQPAAGGTEVSWTMDGPVNFIGKAMGLFINMDNMVGGQFAQGLADLKSTVEAEQAAAPAVETTGQGESATKEPQS